MDEEMIGVLREIRDQLASIKEAVEKQNKLLTAISSNTRPIPNTASSYQRP